MKITLDWLGCATFRLTLGETVVFLDAYMDRVPSAPSVGMTTADVERADFILVGHSHFDHIAGAEIIAAKTGAKIIGSHESGRVMFEKGIPREQMLLSQGGERHRLAPGITVRVLPGLHSCTWVASNLAATEEAHGHLGLCEDERAAISSEAGLATAIGQRAGGDNQQSVELRNHLRNAVGSPVTGGPLAYLIETPAGSIFWQDTSGCWTGVLEGLKPDVAILAIAGRGNVDGEPIQGSLAHFAALEARLLQPRMIIPGHHDNWMPPVTPEGGTDLVAIRAAVAEAAPSATFAEPGYLSGMRLLE